MPRSRRRKMMTREMLNYRLKERGMTIDDLSDITFSPYESPMKKAKWRPEDCAQSVGNPIMSSGEGETKKCYYVAFEFRGSEYKMEDTVLLVPEDINHDPYVAMIKNIYKEGKEGYIKLEVQWFYRHEDVEKKNVGKWESKDSRDLFYSFHRDEVYAESVKDMCYVYFVPDNKQIPNRRKYHEFIVQRVYDAAKKKLKRFTDKGFDVQQKHDIEVLVSKTISELGDLRDIEKVQKTKISRRKRYVPKRSSDLRTCPESCTADNFSNGDFEGSVVMQHVASTSKSVGGENDLDDYIR